MTEMTFIRDNKFAMTRDAKIAGNPEWGPIQKNCPFDFGRKRDFHK